MDPNPLLGFNHFNGQGVGGSGKNSLNKPVLCREGLKLQGSLIMFVLGRGGNRISKAKCYERVGVPRGKLRGPKGLKKGFLLQSGAYDTEMGVILA